MIVKSMTVNGTGAVQQLSIDGKKAKWIGLLAPTSNSSTVLVGGDEVSASPAVGFPLVPGTPQFFPQVSDLFEFYQFSKVYLYVALGDVVNVIYGVEGSNS